MLERLNQEIKPRTHVIRIFPNEESALRLIRALEVEIHEHWIDLASAPELFPFGARAAATSPPAFVNKPNPFPNPYGDLPFAELDAHNVIARSRVCLHPGTPHHKSVLYW
jgi:hypothetical protein